MDRTEREKMIDGLPYFAADPELAAARARARRLLREYNRTTEEESALRGKILGELFGRIGSGAEIEPPFHCDYGTNITAGTGLYMNVGCVVLDCARVEIGDGVLCGPHVQIYAATHPMDPAERATRAELARPVRIGNNVWLGGGAIINPGVTIGDDSVIGAGSVVTRDIPAGVFAAGNPCRVIRPLKDGGRDGGMRGA